MFTFFLTFSLGSKQLVEQLYIRNLNFYHGEWCEGSRGGMGEGDKCLACACECDGSMVRGPKSEVDRSFNFDAPRFFHTPEQCSWNSQSVTVVATALEFALNVRIRSHQLSSWQHQLSSVKGRGTVAQAQMMP